MILPVPESSRTVASAGASKPAYAAPTVTSYTREEILEQVGPALTCSPSPLT